MSACVFIRPNPDFVFRIGGGKRIQAVVQSVVDSMLMERDRNYYHPVVIPADGEDVGIIKVLFADPLASHGDDTANLDEFLRDVFIRDLLRYFPRVEVEVLDLKTGQTRDLT